MTLKQLRKSKKINQIELAKMLGISRQAISMYETGARTLPLDFIVPLSEIFGVSIETIVFCALNSQQALQPFSDIHTCS